MFNSDRYLRRILADLSRTLEIKEEYAKKERLSAIKNDSPFTDDEYRVLEYEDIETKLTDEDMFQIQINAALDSGDKELFMKLTNQKEGV